MITRQRTSRALAIIALVFASGAVALAAGQAGKAGAVKDTSSVVVATVNGEKITRGEVFDWMMLDQAAKLGATVPQAQDRARAAASVAGALVVKKMAKSDWAPVTVTRLDIMEFAFQDKSDVLIKTLDFMVQMKAIAQAAKKEGVSATPAEIAQKTTSQFQMTKQNLNMATKSDAQLLAAIGAYPSHVKTIMAATVNLEKLAKKDAIAKLGHPIGPGDYIAASHILIRVNPGPQPNPANPDDKTPKPAEDKEKPWNEAKKKADGILADIRSGKITFEDAATQFSDDGSKFQKGSLGPFTRGQMVAEFEKAAFSQEKGKVGEPVRSMFGWHIIRVDKLGTELTAKERDELFQRQLQTKAQAKVQEVMNKAKIDNKIKPPTPPGMGMPGMPGRMGQPPIGR